MFEQLLNNPFLYSLSLTLVHFLWQGLLVGVALKVLLIAIDKNKSKLRYALSTIAMLITLVIAVTTFAIVYPNAEASVSTQVNPLPLGNLVNELTQKDAALTYQELIPSILAYSLPYLAIVWLATVIMLAGKLLIEVRNVNLLPVHGCITPTDELLQRFAELATKLKLTKTPKLLISLKADVPMAIGWLKPVVLLPASMVTGLNSAQLEMLLLHELAHIRRHDYLVNFLQTLIELLFFFHPCVHWIGKQMRNEREYCSDDVAVHHCGDAIAYAHTLADTASLCAHKHAHTIPTMAMAASGGDLKARVVRLVDHHCAPKNDTAKWLAAFSLLLALALFSINQMFTLPFSFHLHSQFPWYESNSPSTEQIHNISTQETSLAKFDRESLVTNNSIALQLANSKQDQQANNFIAIETHDVNNTINAIEETTFTASEIESILMENLTADTHTKSAPVLASSEVTKNLIITAEERLANNENIIKETEVHKDIEQNTAETIANPIAKSNHELTIVKAVNTIDVTDAALSYIDVNKTELVAQVSPSEIKGSSLKFEEDTTIQPASLLSSTQPIITSKVQPVQVPEQLTYSQEIDKFELESSQYKASQLSANKDKHVFSLNIVKNQYNDIPSTNKQKVIIDTPVLHQAKLVRSTNPIYPSLAKRRRIEMEVEVNFTIDKNGKVKDLEFISEEKTAYFKSAIRSAIRKWRFTPAMKNNDVIESKMSKIFSFNLQS